MAKFDDDTEVPRKEPLKLNKNKMRKINIDGHFDGKNIEFLDASGKPMDRLEYLKQEAMANRGDLQILEEDEVKATGEQREKYFSKVKEAVSAKQATDQAAEKKRRKEKKLKKKARLQKDDQDEYGEEGAGVQLASASEKEDQEANEYVSDDDVEVEDRRPTKRRKTDDSLDSAEQRALELMGDF